MKRVMFVCYGGGHVAMTVPVALALGRQAEFETLHLALTTAGPVAKGAGLNQVGFAQLVSAERDTRAIEYGGRLVRELPSDNSINRDESIAYLGLSFAELVEDHGEAVAWEKYRKHGRQAFAPRRVLRRAINQFSPDLIVATNSPRAERAAIEAATAAGLPSVCIIDLFGGAALEWIARPGFANRVCVLNDAVREKLLEKGRAPDEVVVTGNPAFDRLADPGLEIDGAAVRRQYAGDAAELILYASQVEPDQHPFSGQPGNPKLPAQIEAALADWLQSRPQSRVYIRPHPSEARKPSSVESPLQFCSPAEPLAPWLSACDAIVTVTSTVGLEAALLGKPVVAVGGSVFSDDMPYAAMRLALPARSVAELPSALERALSGRFRPQTGISGPGVATDNVVSVIRGLLA